jgi:hypothetical protein
MNKSVYYIILVLLLPVTLTAKGSLTFSFGSGLNESDTAAIYIESIFISPEFFFEMNYEKKVRKISFNSKVLFNISYSYRGLHQSAVLKPDNHLINIPLQALFYLKIPEGKKAAFLIGSGWHFQVRINVNDIGPTSKITHTRISLLPILYTGIYLYITKYFKLELSEKFGTKDSFFLYYYNQEHRQSAVLQNALNQLEVYSEVKLYHRWYLVVRYYNQWNVLFDAHNKTSFKSIFENHFQIGARVEI